MGRYSRTKNSTKIFIAATVVAAIIFGIVQIFSCCEGGSGDVIAKVNGKKIYKSQVEHKLTLLLGGMTGQNSELPAIESLPKEVIEILAKEIYLDNELAKIAKKSDATKTDEVENQIRETKNAILRQAYIDARAKEETTDEKLSQKYSELSSEMQNKKEYSVAHILVKTEDEAKKIAKDLKYKRYFRFSDAAKKYSLDKDSAVDGGELGFVIESNLIKEIADEIVKMKKNEISAPIQTQFGWHLVKFSDVRDVQIPPFEEVKENIRQQLIKDILDKTKDEILKDAKIEIIAKKEEKTQPQAEEIKANQEEKSEIAPLDEAALEEKSEVKTNAAKESAE